MKLHLLGEDHLAFLVCWDMAALSIALNLSEGSAKESRRDRRRFYLIALGSVRECEAIVELMAPASNYLAMDSDRLARHVFRLCQALR